MGSNVTLKANWTSTQGGISSVKWTEEKLSRGQSTFLLSHEKKEAEIRLVSLPE